MKLCPTCGKQADVLITNVEDGLQFCNGCAPSSFLPHYILSIDDVAFMMACGIDPEIPLALMEMVRRKLER